MKVTYYGHSSFLVDLNGHRLLFDPYISGNELASEISVDGIEVDFILVSHGHEDHLLDVESIAQRTGAKIISNYEIVTWYMEKGLKNVHGLNHGGKCHLDFGTIKYVNAVHSSILPDGCYGGNPGGFVIRSADRNFYYAGDTALTMDMKLLESENLDFSFLPVGDTFTMGIEDAVRCCDFVGCDKAVAMHYDTFPPIVIDKTEAVNTFKNSGKELIMLEIGQTIDL